MSRIAIVTDSGANLSESLCASYDIHVIPLLIELDHREYKDGIDALPGGLFAPGEDIPTTATPSVSEFVQVYTALSQSADTILSIHTAAKLSSVCSVADLAAKMVEDTDIRVIDSNSAAMGPGFVVLEAARAAAQGPDVQAILRRIARVFSQVNIIATLSDLRYLVHSGRVPAAVGLAGSLLQICPILSLRNGEARLLEVCQTRRHALRRLVVRVVAEAAGHPIHLSVFYGSSRDEAATLRESIMASVTCVESFLNPCTPVMSVHTGPDLLGAAFFAEE